MNCYFRLICLLIFSFCETLCEFSETGKNYILSRHNYLRSQIALGKYVAGNSTKPSASNMMKLIWDTTLETTAQDYSTGCPTGHSASRANIGENMYWWTSPVVTQTDAELLGNRSANLWESEFQRFGWNGNLLTEELFNSGIGHATQMAWATTNKIGCGISKCSSDSFGTQYVVVCLYSPAGNYIGMDIYKSGETCSNCPDGTNCESSTGLCV
ncbi:SCP domain-containing protein [Caenorhabditis elegans]|uniref:SCP domain-containing protein n=1 Tax=Caenorhabditis elegans TaxID=6239 RepID=Q20609_CAEEL|nr:SCP domain-containing protein [Caenorhabditis elegans]CAA94349.1 SCP domain-containing protein [Caenorhabditis elegans]|eukprot:NP_502498.1 SCP-Like extracellular protein [Caenorhabditis elegans]